MKMKLRPAQEIYRDKIFLPRVIKQKKLVPCHVEVPCNFGKTELIVNYHIPETIKHYSNEKVIHYCVTMMADLTTFTDRLPKEGYGKGVWYNKNATDLDYLLRNYEDILKNYDHIVIFTTLNKMSVKNSLHKFNMFMVEGKRLKFKWTMNRDEGDAAAFNDAEHQAFESGASTEGGASLYATEFLELFKTYKDNCLYFFEFSGSATWAHKGVVQLVRESMNPLSLQMNDNLCQDEHGVVTDNLTSHVSNDTVWKRLETEEEFYQMKELNVEYNSFFLEPEIYHKNNWLEAAKAATGFILSKQENINDMKSWLIDNVKNFYPNVNVEKFTNSFDNHQKMLLVQSGKNGEYNKKSFIMPREFIAEFDGFKKIFNIKPLFVHTNADIEGTVQQISKTQIKEEGINMLGCCNLLTRGFDIPYISAVLILSTSPKMDKKSIAAPFTKRHIQTAGRAAREDNGFKTNGITGVKKLLLKLGIDINKDNTFNTKLRDYVWENLKVKLFLLEDDGVNTASYIKERVGRYYVMENQAKDSIENILGVKENDTCPECGQRLRKKILDVMYDNFEGINDALGISTVWNKVKSFFS